jgi:phage-related protein
MNAIADVIRIVLALIKGDWEEVWDGIKSFFNNIWDTICNAAEGFGKIFGNIFEGIKKVVLGVWDGIVDGFKKAINWIIGGINTFIRGLNKIKIPDWVPGVGGKGINISEIPTLAKGGDIIRAGAAIVGEAGPELLELPRGARVTPLAAAGGITININGANIMDDYGVDRMMDRVVERLAALGVTL